MVKWFVGKRRRYFGIVVAIVAVFAVVLALVGNKELVSEHMYPQDAIYENSNVSVRGIVTSIEQDHRSDGLGSDCYHIFRFFIRLNVTEVVWVGGHGAEVISDASGNIISIGYDYSDDPQFSEGQIVECRGFYLPLLDSPYSSMITVAPSVSGSYIELWD